jgi:hypothetical protein
MAYERGTMHVGYDEVGERTEFDAVMGRCRAGLSGLPPPTDAALKGLRYDSGTRSGPLLIRVLDRDRR